MVHFVWAFDIDLKSLKLLKTSENTDFQLDRSGRSKVWCFQRWGNRHRWIQEPWSRPSSFAISGVAKLRTKLIPSTASGVSVDGTAANSQVFLKTEAMNDLIHLQISGWFETPFLSFFHRSSITFWHHYFASRPTKTKNNLSAGRGWPFWRARPGGTTTSSPRWIRMPSFMRIACVDIFSGILGSA